ncbi:MAG: response regulator transcription factor [Candidatus Tectomicrobia bacterium]|nr:response regulator transcription factor [Candidatus Tectomicrobia bacterium]
MRLLLVEDDQALIQRLQSALTQAGFAVDVAGDGVTAESLGNTEPYDVVVLDLGLPERSGLEVLKNWRAAGNSVSVIVLTARDAWHERVDGFQAGADDYLGKPFYVEELVARLNALIRRSNSSSGGPLCAGDLTLDETRQTLTSAHGETIPLTGVEFRLMRYFMLHPGQVLSKSQLSDHVYDWDADHGSNVLEVYVKRLRQKCGREFIQTRRGQGYVFQVSE